MRYLKGDIVTFFTNSNNRIHHGVIIDIEDSKFVGKVYVIKTDFGNYARLTDYEVL